MRPNILSLTSSRFIAALAVVIFHYNRKTQVFPLGLADFGYEAVTFFFILSGFILTYTHGRDDGINVSVSQFARSRLLRIVPAYILGLIVALPFFIAATAKTGHFDLTAILVPAMLQSWWPPAALLWNSPSWSLSNEIFFYALYPLIWGLWRRLNPKHSTVTVYTLVLAASCVRAWIPDTTQNWHHFGAYFPLLNLTQFLLGVSLAQVFLENGPARHSNAMFCASAAALTFIITLKPEHHLLSDSSVLCVVFGAMVYALAGLRSLLLSMFSVRPLVILGDASYAIYILHVPIWLWWDRITRVKLDLHWPVAADFTVYLTLTVILSIAVMLLIERPVRRSARIQSHKSPAADCR